MQNKKSILFKSLYSFIIVLFLLTSCNTDKKVKTPSHKLNSYAAISTDSCSCNNAWFPHSQTPAPLEGINSPFDTSSTTNCIFHQWAWQKFLWLTKPQNNLPLFLNQDSIIQVTSDMRVIEQVSGSQVVLTDTLQAGFNSPILHVNPSYNSAVNSNFTVFYSIHTSPTMLTAAESFKISLNNGSLKPNNLESFPVGSLELKVSWVNVNAIPAKLRMNYFTTTAAISTTGYAPYSSVAVALLGVHVVGVVQNHPEFIWATFEHKDIAPTYDWVANSASTTSEKLLFSTGSTTGTSGILYDSNTSKGKTPNKVFDLFKYGVPRDSSGVYQNTCQQEPTNYNNIDELNQCVAGKLADVWNNYFYNGAIWINTDGLNATQQAQAIVNAGDNIGSALPDSIARGSLNNANVTMETFNQTAQSNISGVQVDNLMNCFTCHSGNSFSGNSSPIYMSHIFDSYIASSQGLDKNQIIVKKRNQQRKQVLRTLK